MGKRLTSPDFLITTGPLRSMLRERREDKAEKVDKSGLAFAQKERLVDENYLDLVRALPSLVSGMGPCIAHHLRLPETDGSAGRRPSDNFAVPILDAEHKHLHSAKMGDKLYWRLYGIDALLCANWLWETYLAGWDFDRACEIIQKCRPRGGI